MTFFSFLARLLFVICVLTFSPQQLMAVSIEELSLAIATAPPDRLHSYYLYRSKAYLALGDEKKGLADIESSLRVKPSAEAYLARGEFFQKTNRVAEAIHDFSSALIINENFLKVYRRRSEAYYEQKNYAKAIIDATRITFYDSKDPFALNMIEKCYLQTSPKERIVMQSNVASVMRSRKALKKKRTKKTYSPPAPTRKNKVASASKKKKKCGPRRRTS